jgi:Putative addiction module component
MPPGIPIPPHDCDQQVPLTEWQRAILEDRLAAHKNAADEARPWPEVIDRLHDRLRTTR